MLETQPQDVRIHYTRLDASGRIVLPRDLRERLELAAGDELVVIEDHDSCRIATARQALAEAQAYFKELVPADVSLVESLLAERRAEAARE